MLVSELLSSSLRKIGAMSSGETIEVTRQAEALAALQSMLRAWGGVSTSVFASIKEYIVLTPSKLLYTWGDAGDINTTRPNQLIGAYILDNVGMTHSVDIISESRYNAIAVKATEARPYDLFFHPAYPLASIYLYPVPNTAEELHINSYKPFLETGSFGLHTDTLSFPSYYEEAMLYNLAIRLAPEYGKTVSGEVALVAKESLISLKALNAANAIEPVYIAVPASGVYGAGYSINTNSYC